MTSPGASYSSPARPIDPGRLAEREATLHPDDPVSIEYGLGASGELEATTLTHRNYLAVTGE